MDRYTLLRELADSWVLLSLVLFFVGSCVFALRPGTRALHRDAAESIFRNETRPVETGEKEAE
ncbi:CcoQ/FixQ family Cbb3-type cytochrome c oxidase assembly chaperone [Paracoccus limosus]|jgi:cytochrome c oxidase cbb3-type subunit 4|uniref:CcoQ/FixQ family Cbb3-type cytochrome c oxidase assembly chaperone n=1 Tax=Paracoccus limosus TaxID=913252 RepID=A0A844GZL9_9RHOB|nr:cbb3-type cytochrome c oxidase subunit 3 [Paracoccus limosus]MTH33235.1 CcoQ/FixQ family Cbb3-type cytochrome c oxidase assembly chaperone [Paracoccus limosus]